jgi:hypothetical protein
MLVIKQNYFNQSGYGDGKSEIFLSFKDFIDFYNLNPDRYEIEYNNGEPCSLNIKEEYNEYNMYCQYGVQFRNKYKIKFKLFSYIRFYYWDKHKQKVKKKYKHNEDMRGMLELVQKDIDSIRKQAEKEIREAERITNEIGRRL